MSLPALADDSVRKVAWAVWMASALEYYAFFLYATAAALVLGPLFFPVSEPGLGVLASLASVGVGYLMRPAGALALGFLGDVFGRRFVLTLSLVLMGSSTFLIGVLPTYEEIGAAAPVMLVLLRLIQGLAVSGEHAGASALALEMARGRRRGLYASLTLSGTQAGLICATVAFLLLSALLSDSELKTWGWRLAFLPGAIVAAAGLWIRRRLPESPEFLAEAPRHPARTNPLSVLWSQYKREVLRVFLAAQISVVSGIVGVYSLSWAVNHLSVRRSIMLAVLLSSAVVGMVAVPVWAALSDRVGRKPVFIFGAVAAGLLIWPYLWALGQSRVGLAAIVAILLAGVAYSAANGVWPALYGEMFSTRVRLSGVAIGTQIGFTLAGQAPAFAAYLTSGAPGNWVPVAWIVSVASALSALAIACGNETHKDDLSDLGRR